VRYIVFTSQAQANRFAADIDAEMGYPRDGVRMGPGRHAPLAACRTLHFAVPIKHPTRSEWAFPDEPVVQGKRGRVPLPGGAVVKELEPDWRPAGP
jgi:hypothetical protein